MSHIVNNYYQPIKKTYPTLPVPEVQLTKFAVCLRACVCACVNVCVRVYVFVCVSFMSNNIYIVFVKQPVISIFKRFTV